MKFGSKHITAGRLGILAAGVALTLTLAMPATALAAPLRIWVDAGHGGKDPGATATYLWEKDSNLAIAKLVIESAKRQGWAVGASRMEDRLAPLEWRPRAANAFKANAFVSIHSNSGGRGPGGMMSIYRSASGKALGDRIMEQLAPITPYGDPGNRQDVRGLAVLRGAQVPATLVELGSVSNATENEWLRDPGMQRKMAEAIVYGIANYANVPYTAPPAPAPAPAAAPAPAPAPAPAAAPAQPATPTVAAPAPSAKPAAAAKAAQQKKADVKAQKPPAKQATLLQGLWTLLFG